MYRQITVRNPHLDKSWLCRYCQKKIYTVDPGTMRLYHQSAGKRRAEKPFFIVYLVCVFGTKNYDETLALHLRKRL